MLIGKKRKEAKADFGNEILENFKNSAVLESLLGTLKEEMDERSEWIKSEISYYDDGKRTVAIGRDFLRIYVGYYYKKEYTDNNGSKKRVLIDEKIVKMIEYSYTKSGYEPLNSISNDKIKLSVDKVCFLWAEAVRDAMKKMMPDCEFGSAHEEYLGGDNIDYFDYIRAEFNYYVPKKETKGWF